MRLITPHKLLIWVGLIFILLIAISSQYIITISTKQTKQLLETQLDILVRSKYSELQNGLIRDVVEANGPELNNLYIELAVGSREFKFGSPKDKTICASKHIQSFEPIAIKACRDSIKPPQIYIYLFSSVIFILLSSLFLNIKLEKDAIKTLSDFLVSHGQDTDRSSNLAVILEKIKYTNTKLRSLQAKEIHLARIETANLIAAQVSHDIRSPLSALNIAVSDASSLDSERVNLIKFATKRINEIASELLIGSRLGTQASRNTQQLDGFEFLNHSQQSKNIDSPKPVDLNYILQDILTEKGVQFKNRVRYIGPEAQKFIAKVNPTDMSRAVSNLIDNAVDASHPNEPIMVELFSTEHSFHIQIKDKGIGIPEDILSRLGERGLTSKSSSTNTGFGLGLHFVYNFIQKIGGSVDVDSSQHLGTTFTLNIPKI